MVERKKLLENSRKIIEKSAADLDQARKENRSRLILMRRKGILTELKEELKNIKQENLEQMLKALEVP
ncbi:MAG: hypothetical protein AVW05_03090 [Hadesarchaea archaeon DG-33]|nr:MAG: hypothetical protein AVW05_03090 [Hadesarchaea archaeon DG-33]